MHHIFVGFFLEKRNDEKKEKECPSVGGTEEPVSDRNVSRENTPECSVGFRTYVGGQLMKTNLCSVNFV